MSRKQKTSLFPEIYNDVAIAYIPGRNGVKYAVEKIKKFHKKGLLWITCLDIKDFFDNIPGDDLYKKLIKRLPDDSINWLVKKTIEQGGYKDPYLKNGVLQGSVLAPFYSNVFLSDFDLFLKTKKIVAVRFADDLAILSETQKKAIEYKEVVRSALFKLTKMHFYDDKDPIKAPKTSCLNNLAEFLGIRFSSRARKLVIGPSYGKIAEEKAALTEVFNDSRDVPTLEKKISKANRSVESWAQHYFSIKCHQVPMREAIAVISNHYQQLAHHFLLQMDIIAKDKEILVFVEVKERTSEAAKRPVG